MKKQKSTLTLLLILLSVPILNFFGAYLQGLFNLPFFFDSIGTVLGVILGGFWIGAFGGAFFYVLSALFSQNSIDWVWALAGVLIAFVVWQLLKNKKLDVENYSSILRAGVIVATVNFLLTSIISLLVFGGAETFPPGVILQSSIASFIHNSFVSILVSHFILELVNNLVVFTVVFGLYKLISQEKINLKKVYLPALAIAVVLIFCALFSQGQKMDQAKASEDAIIKNQTQQALSMLETVYEGYQDGMYPLDQAKKLGADLLRNLRYGEANDGYFWADTTNGTNVVLYGRKDVEGKNRIDSLVNGVYHVREIIANGKKPGGGFTNYYYTKKDGDQPLAKRGYSLYFAPFDWIIGTGYYLADLKTDTKAQTKKPAGSEMTYTASGHPEWPPIMWKKDQAIIGVGPQLVKRIADELGFKVEAKYAGSWDEVQGKAKSGEVDLLAAAYKNTERETYMDYSTAYTTDPIALFVKNGKSFAYSEWNNLIGKKGVATTGDSYGQALDDFIATKLKVDRVKTVDEALSAIKNNQADYFIYALYSGKKVLAEKKMTDQFEILPKYAAEENFYITISKKSPLVKYLPQINELIAKYRNDGTIDWMIEENLKTSLGN
jgi:ABC-type amino acid transport substrate-binding protein